MDRGRWVWLQPPDDAPLDMLTEWIEESYRAVAPKSIVAALPDSAHRLDATRSTGSE